MMKDFSIRIFVQGSTDEQVVNALIAAVEQPDNQDAYRKTLLPYFDVDGTFQVMLIASEGLDSMDTVDRRKLSYRLQMYLEQITHNGSFFYYNSFFVLVVNALSPELVVELGEGMLKRAHKRMPDRPLYVGVGSEVTDIENLSVSYRRAEAAALREIIAEQRALGAKVSEDLNHLQYVWSQEGRLEEIRWGGVSLSGDVSFSAFHSLKKLNLWVNRLDSLDVSQNVMLKRLDCARNQLKSLDVSHNVVLQTLICDSNQLTSLDVSQNVMLQTMSCDSNQLTSLDVSQNTELERLWCSENQLGSLDLTNNKKIRYFNVDEGVEVIGYQPKPTATPEPTVDPNEKVENVMLDYGKDGYLFSRAEQVEFPA